MSFGSRLLQARKKKGISQEDLAGHLGTKGPLSAGMNVMR